VGLEIKKAQIEYERYEDMGIPVTEELIIKANQPSSADKFPYLFFGTTIEDYREAIWVEQNKCCILYNDNGNHTATFDADLSSTNDDNLDMCSEDLGEILNTLYNSDMPLNKTPPKWKQLMFDTPENWVKRLKDNTLFLSPITREYQNSLEKASSLVNHVYDKESLKITRKIIVHSIDHILNHDLVKEDYQAAEFVTAMERQIQNLKEEFTKQILSITGTTNGRDNELTFPSFRNKQTKVVEKRYKGPSG
jgi:hypothetical protein